ncbi:MAG TPA: hypothetical protein DCE56_19590 [Cyanobacteria bacterium UBA8553]|nr:hypothetical protein [Cyanobacteria bacterium UBA8553]
MLIPDGWVSEVFENPSIDGSKEPLFSMTTAGSGNTSQFAQLIDVSADGNSFAFEDLSVEGNSDRDYNDLIFQVQGAIAQAPLLDDVINPAKDWRDSEAGQEVLIYAASNENGPLSNMGSDLAQVFVEYESYLRKGGNPSLFDPTNFLLQVQNGQVVIDAVTTGDTNTLLADLTALGLQHSAAFGAVVSGLLPIESINEVAALNSLTFASPAYRPITNAGQVDPNGNQAGNRAMNADGVRAAFNVNGTGVTVGVISDSYDTSINQIRAANDVASGDLPGNVNVLDDGLRNGTDEGRAMLQIIHDVAPGANLAFHTGFLGAANFAQGIKDLEEVGANVIVDDVSVYREPFFQDGIIAQAVDEVVGQDVAYFSSAGNFERTSYESTFRSSGQRIDGAIAHDFDPGSGVDFLQQISVRNRALGDPADPSDDDPAKELVIALQWDSPFLSANPASGGASNDLNIYLLDDTGTRILARQTNRNIGRDAVEVLTFRNLNTIDPNNAATEFTQFNLVITSRSGAFPSHLKYIADVRNEPVDEVTIDEFGTDSPTVVGHAAAVGAMAVGAANYRTTPAFDGNPAALENFSSVGPTTIRFDSFGTRLAAPEIRQKPEIVAPDGVNTTFFGNDTDDADAFPNFFGTSAAAPHAAAVAALMRQAVPGSPPDLIYRALRESALDMDNPYTVGFDTGVDNATGTGLIQADLAIPRLQQIANERLIEIPDLTFTPPHTFGNFEFSGNGPQVKVETQLVVQGTTLQVVGNAFFKETKSDFTTFAGSFSSPIFDITTLFPDRPNHVIETILSSSADIFETTDVGLHDRQVIIQDGDDLVARYEIQGDTRQRAIGNDSPFAAISFNPVKVRLRSPDGQFVEDTFFLPDITDEFRPRKTMGDGEFDGHGPRISIKTQVVADGTILRPHVSEIFEEWDVEKNEPKSDFTTFAEVFIGNGFDISQQYPGFAIDTILSDSQDTLETIDLPLLNDQTISLDSNELVRSYQIRGDSNGNDQPSVTLSFNPVRVRLQPA